MALTKAQVREILSTAGADSEKISDAVDKIIDGHTASIEALRERVKQGEADAEKISGLQKELKEAQKALTDDSKSPYKVKYDALVEEKAALQKEFDDYKAGKEAEATLLKKTNAYKKLLKDAGVSDKRIDTVLKVSDSAIDKIEFEDDGEKVKDATKIKKAIAEEWSDFIAKDGVKGADTPTPPDNNGGSNFDKMSLAEKMAYANEHADDPDVKAWLSN